MSKRIQTDNGYKLGVQPITDIEEQCKFIAGRIKLGKEYGYDYDTIEVQADERKAFCEHLGVSETPLKGLGVRLFNALMEKYGNQP